MPYRISAEQLYLKEVCFYQMNKLIFINANYGFFSCSEGRRYGKTVIFAKNTEETSAEDENDSESHGEESNSDESMDEGHPPKKPKFN